MPTGSTRRDLGDSFVVRLGFGPFWFVLLVLAGCAGADAHYAQPGRSIRQPPSRRCRENLILVRADRCTPQTDGRALVGSFSGLPDTVASRARRFTVAIRTIRTGTDTNLTASASSPTARSSGNALVEGSGVAIDPRGLVLTNHHVVRRASHIQVYSESTGWMAGFVIAEDTLNDLAIVSVGRPLSGTASLGDADSAALNQPVIAVGYTPGHPVEDGPTFLKGKVTGLNRSLQKALDPSNIHYYGDLLESSVSLEPGHSGGPLLDGTGKVVGINTAAVTHRLTGRRTGYAIPMTANIRDLVQHMLRGQPVAHGYLGVTVCTCPAHWGSVTIDDILPDSPAHQAGLRPGDTIVRWNDTPVRSAAHLAELTHSQQPGQTVSLRTQRTGQTRNTSVTLECRP